MPDDSQFIVPASFIALYIAPGRLKPSASAAEIARRYEHCEDLATTLGEHALAIHRSQGVAEDEILARLYRGLVEPGAGLTPAEAHWVIRRVAELLDWSCPLAISGDEARPEVRR